MPMHIEFAQECFKIVELVTSYHRDLRVSPKDSEQILDDIAPKENNWPPPLQRSSGEVNYFSFWYYLGSTEKRLIFWYWIDLATNVWIYVNGFFKNYRKNLEPKLCSRRGRIACPAIFAGSRTICISWVYPDVENHPLGVSKNLNKGLIFLHRLFIWTFQMNNLGLTFPQCVNPHLGSISLWKRRRLS